MDRNPELVSSTFSSTSSDGDDVANTQYLKDRIETLMKTLSHYQKVVKREQTMNESLQSVNESMRDLQLSSGEMQLELQKKDAVILILQNRLAQLGASTALSLSDDETIVLPSRENFESLLQENRKLRESLKYSSFDPNSLETTLQHLRTLQTEHKALQTKHEQLELEFEKLKRTFEQSEDDKLRQIICLRERLEESERSTDVHSTLCQSLIDEKQELRERLQNTISACQQLQRDLFQRPKSSIKSEGTSPQPSGDVAGQLKVLETENRDLKAELRLMSQDRAKVLAHNAEWQSYESHRQDHVGELRHQVTQLQDRLAKSRDAQDTGFSEKQQKEVDKIVMQYKQKLADGEKKREQITDENRELRQQRLQLQRDLEAANIDLQELRQNMQAMTDQVEEGNKSKERVQLLEEQLKIFSDDFNTERRDREQAVSRVHELEREVHVWKQHYERLTRGGGGGGGGLDDMAARRVQALNRYQQDYYLQQRATHGFYGNQQLVQAAGSRRRIEADGEEERPTLAHEDTIGLPQFLKRGADDGRSSVATNPEIPERAVTARGISGHEQIRDSSSSAGMRHAKTTGDLPSSDSDVFPHNRPPSVAATDMQPSRGENIFNQQQKTVSDFSQHQQQQRHIFDSQQSQGTIFDSEEKRRSFDSSQSGSRSSSSAALSSQTRAASRPRRTEPLDEEGDTLQCPKCQMSFRQDEHLDLLDHINECCV